MHDLLDEFESLQDHPLAADETTSAFAGKGPQQYTGQSSLLDAPGHLLVVLVKDQQAIDVESLQLDGLLGHLQRSLQTLHESLALPYQMAVLLIGV